MLFLCLLAFATAIVDLTYFDARGRGEQFRLWFADAQTQYNDIRLSAEQFALLKKTFPWGHVPVINATGITNGMYLADTAALVVWIGRSSGKWPTDGIQEQVLLDYSGASEDLRGLRYSNLGSGCGSGPAPPDQQTKFLPQLQAWLFYMERNIKASSQGPYLLGTLFTPVDCRMWDSLDQMYQCMGNYHDAWNNFPRTQAFRSAVASRPNIAAYLRNRK